MISRLILSVTLLLVLPFAVSAQDAPPARVRVMHYVLDAPPLQAYAAGAAVEEVIPVGAVTDYVPFDAGTYEVAFAPEGEGPEAAVVGPVELEVAGGHDYTLLLVGSAEQGTGKAELIDETSALADIDAAEEGLLIFIHALVGAPAATYSFDGVPVAENLAYGDYRTVGVPFGTAENIVVSAAEDPDTVLQSPPFSLSVLPNVTWLLASVGAYPGEPGVDHFLFSMPVFTGELTSADGGPVDTGGSVEGEVEAGERVRYALTLADDATLDLSLVAPQDSTLDAYLRVYDAEGELVAENDEVDFEDDALDAGIAALVLEAGEYTVEAGSWNDATPGAYVLSVQQAG